MSLPRIFSSQQIESGKRQNDRVAPLSLQISRETFALISTAFTGDFNGMDQKWRFRPARAIVPNRVDKVWRHNKRNTGSFPMPRAIHAPLLPCATTDQYRLYCVFSEYLTSHGPSLISGQWTGVNSSAT